MESTFFYFIEKYEFSAFIVVAFNFLPFVTLLMCLALGNISARIPPRFIGKKKWPKVAIILRRVYTTFQGYSNRKVNRAKAKNGFIDV